MLLPISTVPPAGFLMLFLVLVGLVAGFIASWISFLIAEKAGYGVVPVPTAAIEDTETLSRRVTEDQFSSQVIVGTFIGGVFAIVLVGTLHALERWYLDVFLPDFVLRLSLVITILVVGSGWILTCIGFARRRDMEHRPKSQPRPVSSLLLDISVFLGSLVVLFPVLTLFLFITILT